VALSQALDVMRTLLLTFVVCGVAAAQVAFSGLTTNRDGSMLLFSSPLRLRGSVEQAAWQKVFSWTAKDGVRLFAQRSNAGFQRTQYGNWDGLSHYHLTWSSVSSDAQTVIITGQSDCSWGTPCRTSVERWQSTVRLPDGTESMLSGLARLSANGRYALARSSRPWGQELAPDVTWSDVRTGQSVVTSSLRLPAAGSRMVADDGSTVRRVEGRLELWRPGFDPFRPTEIKPLTGISESSGPVVLSSDARIIVTQTPSGLIAYEIAAGQITWISASQNIEALDISEDGSVVLIRDSTAYRVFRRNGSRFRDLPLSGTVTESVLSGDGKVVFAVVEGSRIVRIMVETGSVLDVVPTTPYAAAAVMDPALGVAARGSLLRIARTSLQGADQQDLSGAPVIAARFGQQLWPVLTSDPNGVTVQVPWDAPINAEPNYLQFTLKTSDETSPFEAAWVLPSALKVEAIAPKWFLVSDTSAMILAAHEDFGSLVSPNSPARAGEVIHVYGTGFGEVSPPVPTGEAAPGDPLSRVGGDFQCSLQSSDQEPELSDVLFAGLAPGLAGVYQIDVRIPSSVPGTEARLSCSLGTAAVAASGWIAITR
jgi:uncharacterized protein (TIGR03437 family)